MKKKIIHIIQRFNNLLSKKVVVEIEKINTINDLLKQNLDEKEKSILNKKNNNNITVSLTTFGKRIDDVYLAIESIAKQTLKPNRVILWLSKDEFFNKKLPITLTNLQKRGLEIKYCKDLKSYNKIIYQQSKNVQMI